MSSVMLHHDRIWNDDEREFDLAPYVFDISQHDTFAVLRITTGFTDVSVMSVTAKDLRACRDAINSYLGEQPQYVCDGCGDLYEPSRKPNPDRLQYCDTCREDGTAERLLRKRGQRARQEDTHE
tara:strand:- start:4748 stop:5119 length:372 start_codon:yes stop_codon:yes gene_type:complete